MQAVVVVVVVALINEQTVGDDASWCPVCCSREGITTTGPRLTTDQSRVSSQAALPVHAIKFALRCVNTGQYTLPKLVQLIVDVSQPEAPQSCPHVKAPEVLGDKNRYRESQTRIPKISPPMHGERV
ncbi:hypothetical protein RRG08_049188 [Elysia crispata]|uniref:Secreted protein n=1 Tax=Elysia crispata TaxID=231223 RepID=A0AAE1AR76_9GAST|nr:hypothetical protein RRG08_049188 [Elysia crispata]